MYGSCKYIKGDLDMKKLSKIVALCLATTFLFSACSKGGSNESKKDDKKVGIQDNLVVENEGKAVENATLKVAYINDSPLLVFSIKLLQVVILIWKFWLILQTVHLKLMKTTD